MLRDDNLCELQRTLGESALCNICRDHPALPGGFLPGRTEIGLGLCCEEAARLLLSRTEKVTLRGTVSKAPPRETVELLLFRQKLLDAAQDRRLTLGGRMRKILTLAGASLPRRTARAWAAFFASLEPLEPGWTETLAKLAKPIDFAGFHAVSAAWETEYEQLLVYFLLRHLLADEGRALPARAAVCRFEHRHALRARRSRADGKRHGRLWRARGACAAVVGKRGVFRGKYAGGA